MPANVFINGFGRIGRLVLRAIAEGKRGRDINVVGINDLGPVEYNAHLFRYDSVHGRYGGKVETTKDSIDIGMGPMAVTAEPDPAKLPLKKLKADIVLECTGRFTKRESAEQLLQAGARRVLISAPATGVERTVVYGINHETIDKADTIVSNASCTTNCLAPLAWVLHKEFGIERGFMTTVHAYTSDQRLQDAQHSDMHRARAAALSMIPTSTGAARAVGLVLPELKGKLDGSAIRVPTANVSMVDLKAVVSKATSVEAVNEALKKASRGKLKGVLAVNEEPLVSVDFNHIPASSTADLPQTAVVDGTLVRVMSWYDNEWGFSNRMVDTAVYMAKQLGK